MEQDLSQQLNQKLTINTQNTQNTQNSQFFQAIQTVPFDKKGKLCEQQLIKALQSIGNCDEPTQTQEK